MQQNTIFKLEQLIGKSKLYKNTQLIIKSFKNVGTTIVVKTSVRTFNFLPSEIEDFLNNLKDIPETKNTQLPITNNSNEIVINGYQPTVESIELKKSLMNVLSEINKGKITESKLKKAKSICDVANTIVNIQKAEIALINAVKIR